MKVHFEEAAGAAVATPEGRIDSQSAPALRDALADQPPAGVRRLVIDLSGVDFVSSAGLRIFLTTAKRVGTEDLGLFGLNETVREVFEISGFDRILKVYPTREAALAGG